LRRELTAFSGEGDAPGKYVNPTRRERPLHGSAQQTAFIDMPD
jgi:hypothetical protein